MASVKPVLTKRSRYWCVTIDHTIDNQQDNEHIWSEAIQWAIDQTVNWEGCRRMSYDMFYFSKKRDAEKFMLLFSLKWQ